MKGIEITDRADAFAWLMCIFLLGVLAGMLFANHVVKKEVRSEAVKVGVAEWRSDTDGYPEFSWRKP